ncbi:hypothetical protein GCM10027299_13040 [Larkinella ripae]
MSFPGTVQAIGVTPVIASAATPTTPTLKETRLYDVPTQAGKVYTLVKPEPDC